jgi:hypothetical protein
MTNAESTSPFRRRGFIAAAGVVGLIVLAAIVVLVTSLIRGDDQPTAEPTTSLTPTSAPTVTQDAALQSVCGLDGFEDENSLTEPPAADWELVGTVATPTDPEIGPGKVDSDGFRTCFAHTAEGALFAAVNFFAIGTDSSIGPRLIELVAPGPGRDVLEEAPTAAGNDTTRAQIAGYAVGAYTAEGATVDLALNLSTGDLVSFPVKMVWVDGDWKVQMTPGGELPLSPAPLTNLGGYTPWSGA